MDVVSSILALCQACSRGNATPITYFISCLTRGRESYHKKREYSKADSWVDGHSTTDGAKCFNLLRCLLTATLAPARHKQGRDRSRGTKGCVDLQSGQQHLESKSKQYLCPQRDNKQREAEVKSYHPKYGAIFVCSHTLRVWYSANISAPKREGLF